MIVRLKEGLLQMDNRIRLSFQFYDSPIKSIQKKRPGRRGGSFNSMIVRLKDEVKLTIKKIDVRFNSMIVRLKVWRAPPAAWDCCTVSIL